MEEIETPVPERHEFELSEKSKKNFLETSNYWDPDAKMENCWRVIRILPYKCKVSSGGLVGKK